METLGNIAKVGLGTTLLAAALAYALNGDSAFDLVGTTQTQDIKTFTGAATPASAPGPKYQ